MQSFCLRSLVIVMSRTNINDLAGILNALKTVCEESIRCIECFLYDPAENETACMLVKAKDDSLAGNINAALERLEYIKEQSCIMPECPYCPSCVYGLVIYPEEAYAFPEEDCSTEWRCLFDADERVVEKGLEEGGTA